jgi:hypothetical protein
MRTAFSAAAFALLAAAGAGLGQAGPAAEEAIKDRAGFIPARKHEPLKGTAVGVLLYDGQPVLSTEGRSGPADQLCFSANGCSYRWVYVPVAGQAAITNLRVPVGEKANARFEVFPSLDLARPNNVVAWGVTAKYSLVEVEVNNGLGSPRNDSFVATKLKVLDGTKECPIHTGEVIKQLQGRYAAHVKERAKATEAALAEAQKKAIKEAKATGPREQSELMYVTWMAEPARLRVHFRTKITDGQYTFVDGGPRFPRDPPPLPPKAGGAAPGAKAGFAVRRFKTGVAFGVEFGTAYEVDREGKLVRTQVLPVETFENRLPPPPQVGPRGGPIPLPPPPAPPAKP